MDGWVVLLRLFGVAVLAHAIGNPRDPVLSLVLVLAASLLIAVPRRAVGVVVASGAVVASVVAEAPEVGNHWLLAGLFSVLLLVALAVPGPARWAFARRYGMALLLVFYGFAAFAKLNGGFLDPDRSCAVFYADQWLTSWKLPVLNGDLRRLAPIGVAAVEVAVATLLMTPRTRRIGVLGALMFHGAIALDLGQHFYDFSALLVPLFLLFAGPAVWARAVALGRAAFSSTRTGRINVGLLAVAVGSAALLPLTGRSIGALPHALWAVYLIAVLWVAVARGPEDRTPALPEPRFATYLAAGVVALAILNGLTPYLELKTATSFNMYANLTTAAGETNHLLVPRTAHLRHDQDDLVEIVASTDPGLAAYVGTGWLVPRAQVEHRMAVIGPGHVTEVAGSTGRDSISESSPQPWLIAKFATFRAVHVERDRPPCQAYWLPAR